ncbi:MAG TPA: RagB/SusD family nutrient uptake outer membrane protein [Chitinophaga sp.]|uniref:RagB/SusD family nutrient uptake outer membrane protein n=1 Tax=Chitinophaga sp. TaxID=1869181 RepID=UPI002B6AF47F|nr:RagB/SusD family nutrient uptake outer membrane protein [Chitinophaga sp.]HVI48236.1 RagB/SusD family nutrient uptake outer membrane protein [Chitinophaga sp.]
MKNKILYTILSASLLATACQKDYLAKTPTDTYSNGSLWSSEKDATAALNGCYAGWENDINILYMDAVSDNTYSQFMWDKLQHLGNGTATPADPNVLNRWDYTTIQKCNWFLANIDQVKMDDQLKKRFKGEARFLRAYQYFIMSQLYGDVPLVTKSLTTAEAQAVSSTAAKDVRKFVTNELAAITADLPEKYSGSDVGRITKGATLSLKARIELYDKNYAACIADCKQIMGLGYSLYPSYTDLFRIAFENNDEVILDVQYKANDLPNGDIGIMPSSGFGGWSSLSPTQALVDAYEMANGKTIDDPASGYNPDDPYTNRDPRLTASIVYPGQKYEDKYYNSIDASSPDYYNNNNNSPTGYIEKKFTSHLSDFPDMWNTGLNMIVIRYAEVLLTYAEAQIESGVIDNTVYDAIDAVRKRAGMPVIDRAVYNSQDKLRTLVRRERRVELALEGLRWFDIQRWQIGPAVRNGEVYGTRLGTVDPNSGKLSLTGDHVQVETRLFNPGRDYLWPVPQKERDLNKTLGQNPGY